LTVTKLPLIIGHRGASAVAPENTLAAFQEAINSGADGIEFDVRLSRDNIPVVIHDATLQRTARVRGEVASLTAGELQRLNVGTFSRMVGAETHAIPTLVEVFGLFEKVDGVLYLEMKGEPVTEQLVTHVAELIHSHNVVEKVIVECFDHSALALLKRLAPDIRTAALFESRLRGIKNWISQNIIDAAAMAQANEIALHYTLVTDSLIGRAKNEGFEIAVWTVDKTSWVERATRLGIKSLITNDPAKMLTHRG
jgi:glycerophosphoryl diester phosphodiesterase